MRLTLGVNCFAQPIYRELRLATSAYGTTLTFYCESQRQPACLCNLRSTDCYLSLITTFNLQWLLTNTSLFGIPLPVCREMVYKFELPVK